MRTIAYIWSSIGHFSVSLLTFGQGHFSLEVPNWGSVVCPQLLTVFPQGQLSVLHLLEGPLLPRAAPALLQDTPAPFVQDLPGSVLSCWRGPLCVPMEQPTAVTGCQSGWFQSSRGRLKGCLVDGKDSALEAGPSTRLCWPLARFLTCALGQLCRPRGSGQPLGVL